MRTLGRARVHAWACACIHRFMYAFILVLGYAVACVQSKRDKHWHPCIHEDMRANPRPCVRACMGMCMHISTHVRHHFGMQPCMHAVAPMHAYLLHVHMHTCIYMHAWKISACTDAYAELTIMSTSILMSFR